MNTGLLLFILVLINILVLVTLVIWRIVFKGSFRKLLMTFLGLLVENTTKDHVDEPIEMDKSERRAMKMKQEAEAIDFEEALEQTSPPHIEQAIVPPEERGEFARDTSDNGWPRELDYETRRESRPFLDVHLRTDTMEAVADFEDETDLESRSDNPD